MYQFISELNICILDLSANIKSNRKKISKKKSKSQMTEYTKSSPSAQLILEFGQMLWYYTKLLNVNNYNIDY